MIAKEKEFTLVRGSVHFVIPFFQRTYVWREEKSEQSWPLPKVAHINGQKVLNKENIQNYRENLINWPGNMTLLTKNLNASLKNYDIKTKIEGEGRNKGLKDYNDLTVCKEIINHYETKKSWNETDIETRHQKLTAEFLEA